MESSSAVVVVPKASPSLAKISSVKMRIKYPKSPSSGAESMPVSDGKDECEDSEKEVTPLSLCLKKMPDTMPVKRTLEDDDSSLVSLKKNKVSYDFEDDIPIYLEYGTTQRSTEGCDSEVDEKGEQPNLEMRLKEEECDKNIKSKEARIFVLKHFIERTEQILKVKKKELKVKKDELDAKKKLNDEQAKKLESESKKLLRIMSTRTSLSAEMKQFESQKNQFEPQIKEMDSKQKQLEGRAKELESKQKQFECDVKDFESKEKQFKVQEKEHESKQKHFEDQVKKLESKKKDFEGQLKEFEAKEKQLEEQVKAFESKEKRFKVKQKEHESKQKHFEDHVKKLESKKKDFEGQLKEFEAKEKQLEEQVKAFESKEKRFKVKQKEHESKQKHFEDRVKKLESKRKHFEGQLKEFESKEKQLEELVKELESKTKQFEGRVKELELEEKKFDGQVKEFESKGKQFEVQEMDLESKRKQVDGQLKELELKEKQCKESIKASEEEKVFDNQLSPTINGSGLEFLPSEELESLGNDILVNLQGSLDPSKMVLDIIQNPISPQCREGDNYVTIDGGHIILLEQLMKIPPNIKPHVREAAMKLALDLKANMRASAENSLVVLAFLLLVSIYGLVSSFDEDEVLKLLEFAAQHKQAVELFRTLGFADKISDFVQNLIKQQQHIEAVRFICAYNLADKYEPIYLLKEYVKNAKLVFESCCKKTTSIQIKDKARDQEIASLGTVLQCIADNNLKYEDLLNEIRDRILELNSRKAYIDCTDIREPCYQDVSECNIQ